MVAVAVRVRILGQMPYKVVDLDGKSQNAARGDVQAVCIEKGTHYEEREIGTVVKSLFGISCIVAFAYPASPGKRGAPSHHLPGPGVGGEAASAQFRHGEWLEHKNWHEKLSGQGVQIRQFWVDNTAQPKRHERPGDNTTLGTKCNGRAWYQNSYLQKFVNKS